VQKYLGINLKIIYIKINKLCKNGQNGKAKTLQSMQCMFTNIEEEMQNFYWASWTSMN